MATNGVLKLLVGVNEKSGELIDHIPYSRVVRRTPLISAYSLLSSGFFGLISTLY